MIGKQHSIMIATLAALIIIGLSVGAPISAAPKPTKPPTPTAQPTVQPTPQSCYHPQAVSSAISGYVEGNLTGKGTNLTGKELVYNFATFQRLEFGTKATFYSSGRNLGSYAGYVQGFVTNPSAPTNMNTFTSQYSTQFLTTSGPANATIWSGFNSLAGRQGTVHFATAGDISPAPIPVSGDLGYLAVSNPPFSPTENGRSIDFFVNGSLKSYIVNCLVDVTALTNDIRTGNSSNYFVGSSVIQPWRDAAVSAAQSAANDYNQRVTAGAG